MKYLIRAEKYAEDHGDDLLFKNLYAGFREYNGVTESVWRTLSYLYNNQIANQLQNQE